MLLQPNRTYILEDITNNAPSWCEALEDVKKSISNDDKKKSNADISTNTSEPSTSASDGSSNGDGLKLGRKSSSKNSLFNIHIRKIGLIEKTN